MERKDWVQRRQQAALKLSDDNMYVYKIVRAVLKPCFKLLFRPIVLGQANIPLQGAAIITANHRSFWDSAFQAIASPRPIRWMGKSELFKNPLLGRLCVQLGAFPVQRGKGDDGAIKVAKGLLAQGQLVALFPEGTRVRQGIGEPKKGAARLAIEMGVDTIPMSIVGTERGGLRRALWRRGAQVRLIVHPAIPPIIEEKESKQAASKLMKDQVWPAIKDGVQGLEGHRKQALAVGAGAALIAGLGLVARRRKN